MVLAKDALPLAELERLVADATMAFPPIDFPARLRMEPGRTALIAEVTKGERGCVRYSLQFDAWASDWPGKEVLVPRYNWSSCGNHRLQVKRASPSKGDIAKNADAAAQALAYARGGASGISVLTEPTYFKGQLADMCAVRTALNQMYG